MSYRKSKPGLPGVLVFAAVILSASCGFVDLRPIGYSAFPADSGALLPGGKTPVGIHFDTEMNRPETQKAFSVSCNGVPVKGDFSWHNRELSFIPLDEWQAGLRYTLALDGTILAGDGRDSRAFLYVSFYAVRRTELPSLSGFSPPDGASTEINASLVLRFSLPMERFSTEDAISIDGVSEKEFRWSDEDRVLEIVPGKPLLPWTVYRWTLSEKASSKEGAPLAENGGASFITDADRLRPNVLEVCPLVKSGADTGLWWQRTAPSLENGLGSGQALGIVFNKAMDESVQRSVRFEPALAGRYENWTDKAIVFVPDRDPEPETVYTLIVSADAKDMAGMRMGTEYRLCFTADIPYLSIMSVNTGNETYANPSNNGLYKTRVSIPDGRISLVIRFSCPFTLKAKADTVQAMRLEPYFPSILPPVSMRTAHWPYQDTLTLEWENIRSGKNEEAHYYKLTIPGKRGGIADGKGSYLKDDITFILEALEGESL